MVSIAHHKLVCLLSNPVLVYLILPGMIIWDLEFRATPLKHKYLHKSARKMA